MCRQQLAYLPCAALVSPLLLCTSADHIESAYFEMRQQDAELVQPHSYTNPCTLLSILRLSQARARVRLDDIVIKVGTCNRASDATEPGRTWSGEPWPYLVAHVGPRPELGKVADALGAQIVIHQQAEPARASIQQQLKWP